MKTKVLSKKAKEAAEERKYDRLSDENTLSIYCSEFMLPDRLLALDRLAAGAYYWILSFCYPWKSARFFVENSVAIMADGSLMYQLQPLDEDFKKFRLAWIEPSNKVCKEISSLGSSDAAAKHPAYKAWLEKARHEVLTGEDVSAAEHWLPLNGKFKLGDEITYEQLKELILSGPHCHFPKYKVQNPLRPIEVAVCRLGGINYAANIFLKKMRAIRSRIIKKHGFKRHSTPEQRIRQLCVRVPEFVALRDAYIILAKEGRKDKGYQKWGWKSF